LIRMSFSNVFCVIECVASAMTICRIHYMSSMRLHQVIKHEYDYVYGYPGIRSLHASVVSLDMRSLHGSRIPGYTMITRKSRDTIITSYPWIYDHYMDIQGYDHYRDPCNNRISRDTVPRDTIITCGCVWHRYDEFVSI